MMPLKNKTSYTYVYLCYFDWTKVLEYCLLQSNVSIEYLLGMKKGNTGC